MSDNDNTNAAWLRSLCRESARNLYILMMDTVTVDQVVDGVDFPAKFQHYQVLDHTVSAYATGLDWMKFATCKRFVEGESRGIEWATSNSGTRYARFQLNWKLNARGEWETPVKRTRGREPQLRLVKHVLLDDEWDAFKATYLPADDSGTTAISVKILCHHIAYNWLAKNSNVPMPELPENLGHGSSISHLCDNACVTASHLVAATEHSDNTARQRCQGVILLCKGGVILQVVDCPHFRIDAKGAVAAPNCMRVRVIELDFNPFGDSKLDEFAQRRAQFEVAEFVSAPGMSGGALPFETV